MQAIVMANTILKTMWLNNIDVTPLKLQKMLYYIQGFCLKENCKISMDADFEKWHHGPVIKDIYEIFKKYASNNIEELEEGNLNKAYTFDIKTNPHFQKILENVIGAYGKIEALVLSHMTHEHEAWKKVKDGEIIKKALIKTTFQNLDYIY